MAAALASEKGGIRGGGRVSARGAVHMAAALAGCRKALVGTLPFYELHFWGAVHMAAALAGCLVGTLPF